MRRLVAILLIASSAWLLYRTGSQFIDMTEIAAGRIVRLITNPGFVVPSAAGLFVLIGGAIVLAGGVGGAMLALIGGAVVAGFGFYLEQAAWTGNWDFWNNDLQLGIAILLLATIAAVLGRD